MGGGARRGRPRAVRRENSLARERSPRVRSVESARSDSSRRTHGSYGARRRRIIRISAGASRKAASADSLRGPEPRSPAPRVWRSPRFRSLERVMGVGVGNVPRGTVRGPRERGSLSSIPLLSFSAEILGVGPPRTPGPRVGKRSRNEPRPPRVRGGATGASRRANATVVAARASRFTHVVGGSSQLHGEQYTSFPRGAVRGLGRREHLRRDRSGRAGVRAGRLVRRAHGARAPHRLTKASEPRAANCLSLMILHIVASVWRGVI